MASPQNSPACATSLTFARAYSNWKTHGHERASQIRGIEITISYTKFFDPVLLATTIATAYTVPSTPTTTLLRGGRIRLTNTSAGAVAVTLYHVPDGGTAGDATKILPAKSIAANDYLDLDLPIMAAGATLKGLAATGAVINAQMLAGALVS